MTVLTRWERPVRDFNTLQDRVNQLFRQSFQPAFEGSGDESLATTGFAPAVDVYEDEHNTTLKIEVPGSMRKTSMSASKTTPSPCTASASSRRKRKKKTTAASSGSMAASLVPSPAHHRGQ